MANNVEKVVILGCGWLGQIVGESLVNDGNQVYGTYHSEDTRQRLENIEIIGVEHDFNQPTLLPKKLILSATIVFIFIPPSAAKTVPYPTLVKNLAQQFPAETPVVFSSSTGIYPKQEGSYDESSAIPNDSENVLLAAENGLRILKGNNLTVLRLAGLIGPKRHPAYSLSGRTLKDNGSNPVNLIHAFDIVAAIRWMLQQRHFGQTYNLCAPEHPSKQSYYSEAAKHFGISPPIYGENRPVYRSINGNRIEEETSFRYSHSLHNFEDFLR